MGKKRIVKKEGEESAAEADKAGGRAGRGRKVASGTLHVESSYNNTLVLLSDKEGRALSWSSSGSLGFKGAKKGTPFAAAKVGELIGEKAAGMGMKNANVIVKGVGSGRESSIRAFASKGVNITGIKDRTPVPHNGPKAKKPRRV